MLSSILKRESCAKCRVCCGFAEDDKWEIPLIFGNAREKIEEKLGVKLSPRGNEFVFDMEFDGDRLVYCPAASENGCTLGALKPFDCMIWPFRVNALGEYRVITVSPVCESVSALPLKTLSEFVSADNFAEKLFRTASAHPDIVKPYLDGYPIIAVEKSENVNQT
ncbi:MAG: hypothetical protein NC299_04425 [Lachnospiraceae bacterium]|nr:hypothetical protein [Ruminococcus sp.]MCM1274594.1 hypothetical protein [Lachnospiraceae bacterium]